MLYDQLWMFKLLDIHVDSVRHYDLARTTGVHVLDSRYPGVERASWKGKPLNERITYTGLEARSAASFSAEAFGLVRGLGLYGSNDRGPPCPQHWQPCRDAPHAIRPGLRHRSGPLPWGARARETGHRLD